MKSCLGKKLEELPWATENPVAWEQFWKSWPGPWKGLVRKFAEKLSKETAEPETAQEVEKKFQCTECAAKFTTHQGMQVHRFRKHGYRGWARKYISDGWCPICEVNFHTRARSLRHVQYGSVRRRACVKQGVPFWHADVPAA